MRRAKDVSDCVKQFLRVDRYEVPPDTQAHITIRASHPERPTLWVDCYGEVVTLGAGSPKKNVPVQMMNDEQVLITVGMALHRAECRWGQMQDTQEVGIAVPYNHSFWKHFQRLFPALEKLRIRLFFVFANGSVGEINSSTNKVQDIATRLA